MKMETLVLFLFAEFHFSSCTSFSKEKQTIIIYSKYKENLIVQRMGKTPMQLIFPSGIPEIT